jgi:hypothetical protein
MDNSQNNRRIKASYELFDRLKCCSIDTIGNLDDEAALAFIEEDKMRCHILNCMAGLRRLYIQKKKLNSTDSKQESVKRKVFNAAIAMIIDAENDGDQAVINNLLSVFPDEKTMTDERSWLPMHFAISLSVENKISEEDVHVLHAIDPLAMHRLSEKDKDGTMTGFTPVHLLCMQKKPNMSLVRYVSLRDPKAFILCDKRNRCALHYVAQYSESLELLQTVLQIDHTMTKKRSVRIMIMQYSSRFFTSF